MSNRILERVIESVPASDGAGVKLRRSLGARQTLRVDPFLMLDEFSSDNADDYIAGFPAHPHRGFETATYLIDGHMLHQDHLGNRGDLRSGGVQWMTAGRGIVHSEMPQQEQGRMRGFQLWINLPAREKMKPAGYRDIQPDEIPVVELPGGGQAKIIAGAFDPEVARPGARTYDRADLFRRRASSPVPPSRTRSPPGTTPSSIRSRAACRSAAARCPRTTRACSARATRSRCTAGGEGARFLLLAGRPLGEPVVQYGPFVMNTREEIEQAIRDYQSGELTRGA